MGPIGAAGWWGLGLIGLSVVLYAGLLAIPFVPVPAVTRGLLAAGLVVGGEVSFWLGCLLMGPTLAVRVRHWLRPGRRKSPREGE